jgi:DNA-binding SARP family transcriptional activator
MSLRIHLMGVPRIERDGQPVALTANKAIALLACLAVADQPQPRERLLGLLWPESTEDAARKNLRNTLWTIRRTVGDDVFGVESERIALSDAVWVDVRELQRQVTAPAPNADQPFDDILSIRRPFMEGFTLHEAPEFEVWLTTERERLGQLYLRALSARAVALSRAGDWANAIVVARNAVDFDPLQEPMQRLLMEGYARAGQRAEALRQYDMLQKALRDELGVEPLPETEALRDAIMNNAFDAVLPEQRSSEARSARRQIAMSDGHSPMSPFVGRAAEKAVLDACYQQALGGHTQIALIGGEMGIGKTRLWRDWSASLPAGTRILEARGLESTQSLPFAPMVELFSRNAYLSQLVAPTSGVNRLWLAEVARVIPELRKLAPALPETAPLPVEEERRRLFEAFTQLLLGLNAHPLLLFIDDLHWVDHTSLDWLDYLVYRLREQGVLIVGTYRPEDASAALVRLAAGWGREQVLQRISLNRLTQEESFLLIKAIGGDIHLAQHAQAQSAGNPFFLIELSQSPQGDVPLVLSELIRSRLERLPETARQVVQAAGVLDVDSDFDFSTLRRTSGRGEEELLDAVDMLLASAVLVEHQGLYAFSHPLVASVVREGLSHARRSFLHRRAAEAIESLHAGHLDRVAVQLSQHYAESGAVARAVDFAERAAQRALALAAPSEAISLYRRAQALDPSPERQMALGMALQRSNEMNAARSEVQAALQAFLQQGQREGAARASLNLAGISLASGRYDDALRYGRQGIEYLDGNADPRSLAQAHLMLGMSRSQGDEALADALEDAQMHLQEAARLAEQDGFLSMAGQAHFELGTLHARSGDLEQALKAYTEAIRLAQQSGDPMQEVLAHNNYAYHALLQHDLAAAHQHIDIALAIADAGAIQMPRQYLYSTRGEIALAEQKWDEAEEWFRRGIAEAQKAGNTMQAANYSANLGLAAQGRGDLDHALIEFEHAWEQAAPLLAPYLQTQIDVWLAELHLLRHERAAAEERLQGADAHMQGRSFHALRARVDELRRRGLPR